MHQADRDSEVQERNEIRLHAAILRGNETTNGILCPWCKGGENKDKSFSITKRIDGVVLYICHRAKCGKHGRINRDKTFTESPTSQISFVPRCYSALTRVPSREEIEYLKQRYFIQPSDVYRYRLAVTTDQAEKLVIPIYGPRFNKRGYEARVFIKENSGPKTMHYKEVDEPWLGWFFTNSSSINSIKPVVIVEDVLSAIRVSQKATAVSLMSSHMAMKDIMEVARLTDDIILCLDKDATQKAFGFQKKFAYVAPQLRVVPIEKDLKYYDDKSLEEIIRY